MNARTSPVDWLLFVLLGFLWGSSYLFIKIGVDAGLQPFTLIMLRLLIGFALLRRSWSRSPASRCRATRGCTATCRDGRRQHRDAVLADHLGRADASTPRWPPSSTRAVPLFVIVIAARLLRTSGSRSTGRRPRRRVHRRRHPRRLRSRRRCAGDLAGELALIGSTISYAIGAVYAQAQHPRPAADDPGALPGRLRAGHRHGSWRSSSSARSVVADHARGVLAVVWLGLLGSGARVPGLLPDPRPLGRDADVAGRLPAAGLRHRAGRAGPPRADRRARSLLGTVLVIAGIALVNARSLPWQRNAAASTVEEHAA